MSPIKGFITTSDPKWRAILGQTPHDVYHLPEYTEHAARHEGGTPVAFYAETKGSAFLIPLLIRHLPRVLDAPAEWCDATSPYGYPAPITSGPDDQELMRWFWKAFRAAAEESDIVTAFLRLHPLLLVSTEVMAEYGSVVNHGQTIHVDLTLRADDIWSETRENHKRGIRRLISDGFEAVIDDWNRLDEFVEIHRATMRRLSADDHYILASDYFTELRSVLKNHLHLCAILSPRGRLASAGLFTTADHIVQYHLGGTAEAYVRSAPSKLMFDFMRRWAKEAGYRFFHLGGGVGARSDSLFHFKSGFSRSRSDFYTFRIVLNEARYQSLVARWKQRGEQPELNFDFFPIYRKFLSADGCQRNKSTDRLGA